MIFMSTSSNYHFNAAVAVATRPDKPVSSGRCRKISDDDEEGSLSARGVPLEQSQGRAATSLLRLTSGCCGASTSAPGGKVAGVVPPVQLWLKPPVCRWSPRKVAANTASAPARTARRPASRRGASQVLPTAAGPPRR